MGFLQQPFLAPTQCFSQGFRCPGTKFNYTAAGANPQSTI